MVKDNNGDWWMIGAKSSAWYRYDGQNCTVYPTWSLDSGKRRLGRFRAVPYCFRQSDSTPIKAILLFIFLVVVVGSTGFMTGWFADEIMEIQEYTSFYIACVVWGAGLILAFVRAGHTWRGD